MPRGSNQDGTAHHRSRQGHARASRTDLHGRARRRELGLGAWVRLEFFLGRALSREFGPGTPGLGPGAWGLEFWEQGWRGERWN